MAGELENWGRRALGVNKTVATKKHKDHKKEPAGRPTTFALNALSFM